VAFPNTALLSEFDPPAENPLSEGGVWIPLVPDREPLQKNASNQARNTTFGNPDYSAWVREVYPGDAEVWACLAGGQLGIALETWRIGLFTSIGDTLEGYLLLSGGSISKDLALRRYDGNITNFTGIGGLGNVGYPLMMGLKINGTHVEAWTWDGISWSLRIDVVDNTYRGSFFLALGLEDPTGGGLGFECFGGGIPRRTQFFRWLYN